VSDIALPKKRGLVYTEQFNLRITAELKADIRFLDGEGVEVSELLRPIVRDVIEKAKKQIRNEEAS
jgi:hypothetical protein